MGASISFQPRTTPPFTREAVICSSSPTTKAASGFPDCTWRQWSKTEISRAEGPIIPKLYAWKGAKFIRSIEFSAEDKLGFWEVRGYSNTADPWTEDRFS